MSKRVYEEYQSSSSSRDHRTSKKGGADTRHRGEYHDEYEPREKKLKHQIDPIGCRAALEKVKADLQENLKSLEESNAREIAKLSADTLLLQKERVEDLIHYFKLDRDLMDEYRKRAVSMQSLITDESSDSVVFDNVEDELLRTAEVLRSIEEAYEYETLGIVHDEPTTSLSEEHLLEKQHEDNTDTDRDNEEFKDHVLELSEESEEELVEVSDDESHDQPPPPPPSPPPTKSTIGNSFVNRQPPQAHHLHTSSVSNIQLTPPPPSATLHCYICSNELSKNEAIFKCLNCSNRCHKNCAQGKSSILPGLNNDDMICDACSDIKLQYNRQKPHLFNIICERKSPRTTLPKYECLNKLAKLNLENYLVACPKCNKKVSVQNLKQHTGREFEEDIVQELPLLKLSDIQFDTDVSEVMVVFNVSENTLRKCCDRLKTHINLQDIRYKFVSLNSTQQKAYFLEFNSPEDAFKLACYFEENMLKDAIKQMVVHAVCYFWKKNCTMLQIENLPLTTNNKSAVLTQTPVELKRCHLKQEKTSKTAIVTLNSYKDARYLFFEMNGRVIEGHLIKVVEYRDKNENISNSRFVKISNIPEYSTPEQLVELLKQENNFTKESLDSMIVNVSAQKQCPIFGFYYIMELRSEIFAKAFVTNFDSILFQGNRLRVRLTPPLSH
ncbi:hypothetical protein C9374_013860 [Naegleria lovaniensis]|uniref:RRM domain-containing protein n=1 Tax=Naegleria lovaniensis TaxID=51637 RepID=A0AA88GUS1_NAELO|nr:uncharacterized protein C9374_013860 [Naegleria lovaniensis]KAG2389300.1 hypothetical protein C9374_013860 [Naegleria lovaniensis]